MRSNRILLSLAALALAFGCTRLPEETAPVQEPAPEVFVSKVSGNTISMDAVTPATIMIKVNDALAGDIEACNADIEMLSTELKSVQAPFAKIRPRSMERLFPHAGEYEERTRAAGLHKWYKLEFDESISLADAEVALAMVEDIEIVDFDYTVEHIGSEISYSVAYPAQKTAATSIFNDEFLPQQWHYYNDGSRSGMVAGSDIDVVSVWDAFASGNSEVIVGVVDGGIDLAHEDLSANIWKGASGINGYNFVDNNYVIYPHDHGTHVAGTIAAVNNNEIGVCGIAGGDAIKGVPGVRLMSCQMFKTDESGKDLSGPGYVAIKWSADNGAVISQNSWSYKNVQGMPSYCAEAVDYFIKNAGMDKSGKNQVGPMAGGVVIFAAGNDNTNICFPGAYEKVIAVSAIGADYRKAYYSNYGDWCDIIAPGGDAQKGFNVLSTLPGNKYGHMQGTSMACPHVSGVAALIVANMGGEGFTNERLKELLLTTVNTEVLEHNNLPMGSGLVSATNAIAFNKPVMHVIEPEGASKLSMKAAQTRQIAFVIKNPTGHALKFSLTPEVEGVELSRDLDNPSKRVLVKVNGPEVLGDDWDKGKDMSFTLSVACDQEPDITHSLNFDVSIAANNAPIILKQIDGIVADKLGDSQRLSLDGVFFDSDGETLNYSVTESTLGSFKIEGSRVTFTPSSFGQDVISITASDMFGAAVSADIKLLVRDSTRPGGSGQVDMYPNPVIDKLNLRTSEEVSADVKIYSLSGACVYDSKLELGPFAPGVVDMSSMSAGTYTVKILGSGIDFSGKVVKI